MSSSSSPQLPATQRAWRVFSRGEPKDALKLDAKLPVPTNLKSGEVLIKVQAAALNPVGYKLMRLIPKFLRTQPDIAEHDFTGVVADANATNWSNGDAVIGWIPFDLQRKTGYGALCEYTVVPSDYIVARPNNIKPTEAAGIGLAGETAYQALFDVAKLEEGQSVFINGGSTAVGSFAIQFAKAKGIRVVATASAKNEEYVRGLGADDFIDYTKQDLATYLTKNPPTTKYNAVIETVGLADPSLYAHSANYLAPGGIYVSVGPQPGKFSDTMQLLKLLFNMAWPSKLGGVPRKFRIAAVKHRREVLDEIRAMITEGKVKGLVDSVYAFEDTLKAYDRIMTKHACGKVVIKVEPDVD